MIPFLEPRFLVDELRRGDADGLSEIHGASFARGWKPYEFAALLGERAVLGLAARRESALTPRRLAGFLLARAAADEAEILTVAVRAASRRRGLGRKLMEEALRRLYRAGIVSVFLEVDRDNAAAVGLYRSLGFETVGERKGYYERRGGPAGTALVMRLQLR